MAKSCIPGYDDALAEERRLREEVFVSETTLLCGVEVRHITPFLLALIFRMDTPFLGNGEYSVAEVLRFLWVLSPGYCRDSEKRDAFFENALPTVLNLGIDNAIDEIEEFIDDTFLDAPEGGEESVPYVCSVAWMLFKMKCEPHRMTRSEAGNTPVREIYQYIKCAQYERGDVLYNSISDPLKATWLSKLREKHGQN